MMGTKAQPFFYEGYMEIFGFQAVFFSEGMAANMAFAGVGFLDKVL